MASISSTSSTTNTNSAYSSSGLSGLVSGLDTEQMVKEMLTGTQTKIDSAKSQKQVLGWKQSMYRDVISSLQTFQTKYFSFSNEKTNLLSTSFFNTMSTSSSTDKLGVSASSKAESGTMTVNSVTQLATQTQVKAKNTASGALAGTLDLSKITSILESRTIDITVDGFDKTQFKVLGDTESEIISNLNSQFAAAYGADTVVASVTNGTFSIKTADPEKNISVGADSDTTALSILGLTAGESGVGDVSGDLDLAKTAVNLNISLDGIQKTISLNTDTSDPTVFTPSLQDSIQKAFGNGIEVTYSSGLITFTPKKITYTDDGSGNLVPNGEEIDPSRQIILSGTDDVMSVFGIANGASNKISTGMTLGSINFAAGLTGTTVTTETGDVTTYGFTINGVDFSFNSTDKLSTVINTINSSDAGVNLTYSTLEDKFVLTSKNYGAGNDITMSDKSGSNFLNVLFGSTQDKTLGKNAILRVNDTDIQRNSNTFTIDGVTLTLKDTFDTKQTVNVSRNTEQIQTGIAGFVADYNSLIDGINKLIHSDATYKDYPPLTSEQKAEMSDKEIELWEEKAKEGLLRGDSTISDLLTDMRSTLYSRVEGSKYALYDLGIDTSSDYKDYGKLVIKDSSKIANAIENDPDSVEKLFNDPVNGLATKLNTLLNKAAKVSYSSPGSLVSIAGSSNLVDENSTIGKEIIDLNDKLDKLQDQYSSEKERYWKQFNSMETLINQMNQQSTWLASQFS